MSTRRSASLFVGHQDRNGIAIRYPSKNVGGPALNGELNHRAAHRAISPTAPPKSRSVPHHTEAGLVRTRDRKGLTHVMQIKGGDLEVLSSSKAAAATFVRKRRGRPRLESANEQAAGPREFMMAILHQNLTATPQTHPATPQTRKWTPCP